MPPYDFVTKIAVTNEPTRLVNVSTPVRDVDIEAASTNSGDVLIGGEHISSLSGFNKGTRLEAGAIKTLEGEDLYDWWIIGTAGDYVFGGGTV